jgi:hypothetical protein
MEYESELMYSKPAVNDHTAIANNRPINAVALGKRRCLHMNSANATDVEAVKKRGSA